MSSSHDPLTGHLLDEFPPATHAAWRAAAEQLLKGAPFDKRMVTRTHEGIDLQPIYNAPADAGASTVPGAFPFRRGLTGPGSGPWLIAQELPYPTYEEFNHALRNDLERGQNAVYLALDRASLLGMDPDQAPAETVGSGGASVASIAGFGKALDGIDLTAFPLYAEAGVAGPPFLAIAIAHARKKRLPLTALRGCIGSDPLALLAAEGGIPASPEVLYDEMAVAAEWAEKNAPGLRTIAVSTRPYADGGAHAVEELGVALATGAAYMRALVGRGMHPDHVARQIWFAFTIGPQFFMEVAKLRAARMAWAHVASSFGAHPEAAGMVMHCRTSAYDATKVEPYVNMLRVTTEALAAAVGGCQSMHVGCFDGPVRMPDEFSRRIARNVQILLQSEAHVHRVTDPAGGSWYVESLTSGIAERAWALFQEIEAEGGMAAALVAGTVQKRIAATAARRADALAHRKDVMVGVTNYADPFSMPLPERPDDLHGVRVRRAETLRALRTVPDRAEETAVIDRLSRILETGRDSIMNALIDAAAQGATIGEMGRAWRARRGDASLTAARIPAQRRSAAFEELRAASQAFAARTGAPPAVFLATMGPVGQYKARADFAAGFVTAGGCRPIMGTGFAGPEDAVDAAVRSGAPVMVICSTDETYPSLVPAICALVREGRLPLMVVLAGYPQEHIEAFRAAGVEEFIHVRADAVAVLRHLLVRMGVMA